MPYLWIDPPGPAAGWLYDLTALADDEVGDAVAALAAKHDIPADNAARQLEYDLAVQDDAIHHRITAEQYQAGRTFWGVTVLHALPSDLPDDLIRL